MKIKPDWDYFFKMYAISLSVIAFYMGSDWSAKNIDGSSRDKGFLLRPQDFDTNYDSRADHVHKTKNLAEMLYNLQWVDGFDFCVSQLMTDSVADTYAEFETASLLYQNKIPFRFVEPTGEVGSDFDLEILINSQGWISADTKNKAEGICLTATTVFNILHAGRKRLPENRPSFLFIRIPPKWVTKENFPHVVEGVKKFFASGAGRVASVKIHTRYTAPISAEDSVEALAYAEMDNPQCRFHTTGSWAIFPDFPPKRKWKDLQTYVGYPQSLGQALSDSDKEIIQRREESIRKFSSKPQTS